MKIDVLDKSGKKIEELKLEESVFGVVPNVAVMKQYISIYTSNQRQGTSSSKDRGEVSGGGKKPWRQKGTGRARVGSTRSPIWVHGGIAHGPKPKSWRLSVPKKILVLAMKSALSFKHKEKSIKVLDYLEMKKPSAKELDQLIKSLGLLGKTLLVLPNNDQNILKSTTNLKNVIPSQSQNLNTYEVLDSKNILFLKEALKDVQEKYK